MAGFETLYERAITLKITGEAWIDGSFLTRKMEPEDIDFIFIIPSHLYDAGSDEQVAFIDWLIDNEDEPKTAFFCHTDVVLAYQPSHLEYGNFAATLQAWEQKVYGFSVSSKEPKGIAVVKLREDAK